MKRVNITLDAATLMNIDTLSRVTGANRSEIIRRAVVAYIPIVADQVSGDMKAAFTNKTRPKRK